jgi:FkbM family methyltransferase
MRLSRSFSKVAQIIYAKFSPLLKMFGLFHPMRRLYERVLNLITSETSTVRISGIESEFHTEMKRETTLFHNGLLSEEEIITDFVSTIRPDDTVFDIGAHLGIYSVFAANKEPSITLHSFEPLPRNATRLQQNLRLNNVNAKVHRIALSDTNGSQTLNAWDDAVGHSMASLVESHENSVEVETRRGDTMVADFEEVPNVLKVDVEGAERYVIEGLSETLRESNCRAIYCEIHEGRIPNEDSMEIITQLQNAGFETEWLEIDTRTDARMLKGSKTPTNAQP